MSSLSGFGGAERLRSDSGPTRAEIIPLVAGEKVLKAWETGDINSAPMMVGQSIGLIHSVPTCAELLETMMVEARECLQKTTARIQKQ